MEDTEEDFYKDLQRSGHIADPQGLDAVCWLSILGQDAELCQLSARVRWGHEELKGRCLKIQIWYPCLCYLFPAANFPVGSIKSYHNVILAKRFSVKDLLHKGEQPDSSDLLALVWRGLWKRLGDCRPWANSGPHPRLHR
ncbi:hypothetical protein GN956_G14131 [Arapaima gigas]